MKKLKKFFNKKLFKILGIIFSIFILFILLEYGYSQRWRLEKDVGVENYEKQIVYNYQWNLDPHLSCVISRCDYDSAFDYFGINKDHDFFISVMFNHIDYKWKISNHTLFLEERTMEYKDEYDEKSFPLNVEKSIRHLGKNYLVFDEKDTSVLFPFIPRKKMYMKHKEWEDMSIAGKMYDSISDTWSQMITLYYSGTFWIKYNIENFLNKQNTL